MEESQARRQLDSDDGEARYPEVGSMAIDRIDRQDVLSVLEPIWTTLPETARRIRQRLRPSSRGQWLMATGWTTPPVKS